MFARRTGLGRNEVVFSLIFIARYSFEMLDTKTLRMIHRAYFMSFYACQHDETVLRYQNAYLHLGQASIQSHGVVECRRVS